jgi:hypothetical protein
MSEMVFVEGLRIFLPHQKAPSFIRAKGSINPDELAAWCADKPRDEKGNVRIEIRESKGGKLYACLDSWKPEERGGDDRATETPFDSGAAPKAGTWKEPEEKDLPF